jgi:hypothetical protein
MAALALAAVGLTAYTIACVLDAAPWLHLPLRFGDAVVLQGGIWVQSGVTAVVAALTVYLPTNARVLALETSHRSFHMGMRDVARAYAAAHRADREGVFTLSSEFDSVRERIAFLRDHPDLADLEPSVLELAAQMSHVSRELAETYADSKVRRARDFLTARQQEVEHVNTRIEAAKAAALEIRRWSDRVEMEEAVARAQLDRLREQIGSLMPELRAPPELRAASPPPGAPADETGAREPGTIARLPRAAE